jgi:hypothetical protein
MVEKESRPNSVRFETRAIHSGSKSVQAGHAVYDNVDFVIIRTPGSRDTVEKKAEDWLRDLKKQALDKGRVPMEHLRFYEEAHKQWKQGNEIPVSGTPIKMWPAVTPAEVAMLTHAGIMTIEDLAELTESGLRSLGIGGRAWRDKARGWLVAAVDQGKLSEQFAELKNQIALKDAQLEQMQEKLRELEAAVVDKRGPGRPPKVKEAA